MAHQSSPEMIARLEESTRRFEFLTEQLTQPETINDRKKFSDLSRERSNLEEIISVYGGYAQNLKNYLEAREILINESDSELKAMATSEISTLEPQLESQSEKLQFLLLPKDPNDEKNVLLEIRAGVGGDEAGIFVGDLFRMYQRFSEKQRWKVELISASEGSAGGYKEIIALIEGERAYSTLKYESGVHRVQRVPKTEAQGRVHTSTVTVAVLPEAEEVDIVIEAKDLRIDVYRAGGHGGQSVNTTDSAVRITYLPTNEVVVCQDEKSQLKNKNKAMKVLRSRLLEKAQTEQHNKIAKERRAQVGTGFRNERIRTYNFPQGRITDHRIGLTQYNLTEVVSGDVGDFTKALAHFYQTLALKGEAAANALKGSGSDEGDAS
jgi:peptide chain release factor 1